MFTRKELAGPDLSTDLHASNSGLSTLKIFSPIIIIKIRFSVKYRMIILRRMKIQKDTKILKL